MVSRGAAQGILEQLDVPERVSATLLLLKKELELVKLQSDISRQVEGKISADHRRYMLMEHMKYCKKELGLEKDDKTALVSKFQEQFEEFRCAPRPRRQTWLCSGSARHEPQRTDVSNSVHLHLTAVLIMRRGAAPRLRAGEAELLSPAGHGQATRPGGVLQGGGRGAGQAGQPGALLQRVQRHAQLPRVAHVHAVGALQVRIPRAAPSGGWHEGGRGAHGVPAVPGPRSAEKLDIAHAQAVLDEDHYGLEDVKERILEFIAVGRLRGTTQVLLPPLPPPARPPLSLLPSIV